MSCTCTYRWYYGKLNCAKAEKLLMNSDPGSFLVRDSEVTPGNFVLSVQGVEGVNHYPIQYQWLGSGSYCVTQKASFASISDLVGYYHKPSGDLCSVLTFPCVMAEKPPTAGLSKQANKEWEIDWKQIRFLKKIGAGGFAEVWEGLWNMTMPVAIKTFKPGLLLVSEFLLEAEVIRKFFHPNLTPLYAVCTKEEPLYIITELMKHGSLLEFLRCKESRSLEHSQLIDMAAQVASGMAYLEEKNYVHRELAARNVLVGENLICKVTDFGFTKFVDDDYMIHRVSIKWTAPEALLYNRFTIKSDVWSFGIVLYEIITYGRIPYPGIATSGILEAVSEGTYRMPCPPNCPIQLYDIMLDCWKHELDNRPSFKTLQLLLEEFFSNSCEQKAQPN